MAADTNAPGDWASAMHKAQADMLRQWTDMSQVWVRAAMPGTGSPPAGAGAGAMGASAGSGANAAAEALARNFLQQCEQYLGVSRSLWDLVGHSATASDAEQRARAFTEGLGGLQQQFAGLWAATPFGAPVAAGLGAAAWPGAGTLGAGFPGMNAFAGGGGFPGMTGFPGGAGFPGMTGAFNVPALGPTREQQESLQRLSQLIVRCTQAQMQVSSQWNDIIGKALRELGERLAPRLRSGTPPGSMKEIYDLWVDTAESVYAQTARSAAFVQAQGELTNSISQLRTAQRELLEEFARQFDLPTRAELNSIHQQLRELKAALAGQRG
jgi:hypothetical protein